MAFVDDDEVEEVGWVDRQSWVSRVAFGYFPAMKVWKMVLKNTAFFGDAAFFARCVSVDANEGIFGKGREVDKGLVGQNVAVS